MVWGVKHMSAESEDLYTEASERGEATAGHKHRNASRSTLYSHLAAHGYAPDTDVHDDAYEEGLEKGLELCADETGEDAYLDETTARAIHYTTFPALSMGAVWQFLEGNYDLAGLMAEGAVMEAGWYGAQRKKRSSDGFTDSNSSSAAGGCTSPAASHPLAGVPTNGSVAA